MRIGIVGAGMIGSTMAKLWADAGHDIRLASRHPAELGALAASLGSRVSVGTSADAAAFGEVVMLTVPLKAVPTLAAELAPHLAGKIVIDTGNAYQQRDGQIAREASGHTGGSAAWAADPSVAAPTPRCGRALLVRVAGVDHDIFRQL